MFKKIFAALFGKCETQTTADYPFPKELDIHLPHKESVWYALDYARSLADALDLTVTEVELLFFLVAQDHAVTEYQLSESILHVSEAHIKRMIRKLIKAGHITKENLTDSLYLFEVSDQTKAAMKKYTY